MDVSIYLAHGALGYWDEVIFAGVAVLFLVMMGISWMRSLNQKPDDLENPPDAAKHKHMEQTPEQAPDRFRLE